MFDFIKTDKDSSKLFAAATSGISILEKFKDLTNEGKFEVILFNSLMVLHHYRTEYSDKYLQTEEQYFKHIDNQSATFNLTFNQDQLNRFINNRFQFYSNEIDSLYEEGASPPGKIYNAFYENPLSEEPEQSFDLGSLMLFSSTLVEMMNFVTNELKKV